MANFKYQVVDSAGKSSSGVIDANSMADAARKLRADGKYVASLELDKGPGLLNMELGSPKLKTKELVLITRQLASLLSAGITVVRALDMLYQQVDTKKSKRFVGEVYEAIQSGKSMSEAFRDQKNVIPNIMISMVTAGEESGRLDEIMERLAEHFQKSQKIKNKVSSAMVYPKILAFVTVSVSVGLLTFLVPSITKTIAELGGELPTLTKGVIAVSDSMVNFWYLYLLIGGILVYGFKAWKTSEKGARTWATLMLKLPIVGKATTMTASAQFTRTVSTLLKSGIS